MPSFYQVYNVDEVIGTDLDYSKPTTLEDAFSQSAQLEAQSWLAGGVQEFWERYEPDDREIYTVQPSPWGYEEAFDV